MTVWFGVSSANLGAFCGEELEGQLAGALNGTHVWEHFIEETHYFELDLGNLYVVTKVKGRSNTLDDPTVVSIYGKVASGDGWVLLKDAITTFQDTDTFQEVVLDVIRPSRYIKVEIRYTEDRAKWIRYGKTATFTIFDIGYDLTPPLRAESGWEILSIRGVTKFNLSDLLVLYNGTYYTWIQATTNDNEKGEPLILTWVYAWDYANQYYISATTINPNLGYWFYWYHYGALFVNVDTALLPIICIPNIQVDVR